MFCLTDGRAKWATFLCPNLMKHESTSASKFIALYDRNGACIFLKLGWTVCSRPKTVTLDFFWKSSAFLCLAVASFYVSDVFAIVFTIISTISKSFWVIATIWCLNIFFFSPNKYGHDNVKGYFALGILNTASSAIFHALPGSRFMSSNVRTSCFVWTVVTAWIDKEVRARCMDGTFQKTSSSRSEYKTDIVPKVFADCCSP